MKNKFRFINRLGCRRLLFQCCRRILFFHNMMDVVENIGKNNVKFGDVQKEYDEFKRRISSMVERIEMVKEGK